MNTTTKRFQVRDIGTGITRTIRERYEVIDTDKNIPVDAYSTKRAAEMDAKYRNTINPDGFGGRS